MAGRFVFVFIFVSVFVFVSVFEDEDEEGGVVMSYGRQARPDDTHSLKPPATDENFTALKIQNPRLFQNCFSSKLGKNFTPYFWRVG